MLKVKKELRPVIDYARAHDYDVTRTRGGHIRLSKPGVPAIFASSTPSDIRSTKNVMARLRRSET